MIVESAGGPARELIASKAHTARLALFLFRIIAVLTRILRAEPAPVDECRSRPLWRAALRDRKEGFSKLDS
jgi:hypothetical protein